MYDEGKFCGEQSSRFKTYVNQKNVVGKGNWKRKHFLGGPKARIKLAVVEQLITGVGAQENEK